MTENFMGFYVSPPCWAVESIDITVKQDPQELRKLLNGLVYRHEADSFRLLVRRDGMVALQLKELEAEAADVTADGDFVAWWSKYLEHINCLNLLLDSTAFERTGLSYFQLSEMTNNNVFRVTLKDEQIVDGSNMTVLIRSMEQMARFLANRGQLVPQYESVLSSRETLPKEVFEGLAHNFEIVVNEKSLVALLSRIAKSLAEYKIGNYSTSLVLAWFAIESMLNRKWNTLLGSKMHTYSDGVKRIDKDRKKFLTGRDFTASVVSNLLEIMGVLPFEMLRDIDKIRKRRNAIVHPDPDNVCTSDDCTLAIRIALDLVVEGRNLTIKPNLSFSVGGP